MKLDDFISEALKSIIRGIKDAQVFAKDNNAVINPEIATRAEYEKAQRPVIGYSNRDGLLELTLIEFDIATTASNQQDAEGQAGINVLSIKAGGAISESQLKETVSRIKFNLNVALPSTLSSEF